MIARAYQSECLEAVRTAWDAGHQRADVVLPTGMGKTVVQSLIAHEFLDGRVMIVEPLNELVDQTAAKLTKITGEAPGIEQAERWSNESSWGQSSFVVASIHTLCGPKARFNRFRGIGLVIIDEQHKFGVVQREQLVRKGRHPHHRGHHAIWPPVELRGALRRPHRP